MFLKWFLKVKYTLNIVVVQIKTANLRWHRINKIFHNCLLILIYRHLNHRTSIFIIILLCTNHLRVSKAANQTLHLFTPHGKYRSDFRNIQGFIFSITACLVWLTAETWRSKILALEEGNIKPLHQSQVNKKHMKVMIHYKMLDSVYLLCLVLMNSMLKIKYSLFTSRQKDEITSATFPQRRSRFFLLSHFCHCDVLWEEARTGNQSQEGSESLLYIWMWHHLH